MSKRGAFIAIEGLDRSGKTTQTSLLQEHLKSSGVPVQLFKIPDRTTAIGKMIDSYLRSESELDDHAIHLLFSANRWELASKITSLLKSGTTVIVDRYAFSGIAFSAAKGLPYDWCRAPDISLPAPDLTIFFDISPEKALERGGYGQERYEKEEMQQRVRVIFERIGTEMGVEGPTSRWVKVDAGKDRDAVQDAVSKLVEPLVGGIEDPLHYLWEEHLTLA